MFVHAYVCLCAHVCTYRFTLCCLWAQRVAMATLLNREQPLAWSYWAWCPGGLEENILVILVTVVIFHTGQVRLTILIMLVFLYWSGYTGYTGLVILFWFYWSGYSSLLYQLCWSGYSTVVCYTGYVVLDKLVWLYWLSCSGCTRNTGLVKLVLLGWL